MSNLFISYFLFALFCGLFALSRILALHCNCKKIIIEKSSYFNSKYWGFYFVSLILVQRFIFVFRIMSHSLKYLLLVSIAVLYMQAISAKDYDVKFEPCVTPLQFRRILNFYCANSAHKRGIRREGETEISQTSRWWESMNCLPSTLLGWNLRPVFRCTCSFY